MSRGRARVWIVLFACTAGCGRISFDARATSDATGLAGDAASSMLVQRASDSIASGTTLSVTMPTPPVSGHVLVMVGGSNIAPLPSVSGGAVAWTRAASSTVHPNIEVWFGTADGSSTVTINAIGATGLTIALSEWSGLVAASPLDTAVATAGMTSPASAGAITTTHAPDVVVFGVADYLPNTFGTPTGGTWIQLDSTLSNSAQTVWYQVATAPGTYEGKVSETVHMWDAAIAAFRIAP